MWQRINALMMLAVALLVTLVRRPFSRQSALRQFAKHYGSEGILSVTAEEHEVLIQPNSCVACGRCDEVLVQKATARRRSLMAFVLSGTRALADADAGLELVGEISREELEEAERICPESVPIGALLRLARSQAARRAGRTEAFSSQSPLPTVSERDGASELP